ncbi:DNA-binding PadR family transcriptional regulator [Alkalihalobacillus xiaoxiensis]|uniref:DNA-binding PadR family transcriptional regulator n=1 Tax=Shouchella xiaoxiensis TaxID=766895 RepID=A0ABS2SQR9_9BACI|nr:DNA-binding PadR family transcriptional regulator [Shouchella xiaoxiensis]
MKQSEHVTDSMFYIMAALTEPRHGYAIMQIIEETTSGAVSIGPASMYTIIKKLLKQDWICPSDETNSRRKTYRLTGKGKDVLRSEVTLRKQLLALAEKGLQEGLI